MNSLLVSDEMLLYTKARITAWPVTGKGPNLPMKRFVAVEISLLGEGCAAAEASHRRKA